MDVIYASNIIKAARISAGLSQDEIAELAGVSRDTIQKLEQESASVRRKLYARVITTLESAGISWLPSNESEGEGFRQNSPAEKFTQSLFEVRTRSKLPRPGSEPKI